MGDLERDTQLSGNGGAYTAQLNPDWEIWGPNGGYVASIALRAAGELAAIKRPVSFYCHFIRTPRFGPVTLKAEVVQQGRRAESIRVSLFEADKPVLEADHASPIAEGGLVGAQGCVYDRARRLLASGGAQLLCVPAPPATG